MEKDKMVKDLKFFILANDLKLNSPDIEIDLQKNVINIYLIRKNELILRSLNYRGIDKELSDLEYADLFNFKRILENFNNDQVCDFKFFSSQGLIHLVYPFKTKDDNIYIAVMEKRMKLFDDYFKKN